MKGDLGVDIYLHEFLTPSLLEGGKWHLYKSGYLFLSYESISIILLEVGMCHSSISEDLFLLYGSLPKSFLKGDMYHSFGHTSL